MDLLKKRIETSQSLGIDKRLVLHGGGNTSVKLHSSTDLLYVKGSGYNLDDISARGFTGLPLEQCLEILSQDIDDIQMMDLLNRIKLEKEMPSPSVEALMHAVIPYAFVDHSHASSVVTISNTPNGRIFLEELFPDFLIVPYVRAGIPLAKQFAKIRKDVLEQHKGVILLHHGVVTYSDDADESLLNMTECENRAEEVLNLLVSPRPPVSQVPNELASQLRERLVSLYGTDFKVSHIDSKEVRNFVNNPRSWQAASIGTLTPDHVIRIKPFPLVWEGDLDTALNFFFKQYEEYFQTHKQSAHIKLSDHPCWCILPNKGVLSVSRNSQEAKIISDLVLENIRAITRAQNLDDWKPLNQKDLFDIEYWELEQRKLKAI